MYRYDTTDKAIVLARVRQFRDQTARYLAGQLSEDEFRPLRLRNGLYIQRHAPMLRIAIPYGLLSSEKLRMLAHIVRTYDRGYGHFTTRQNLQLNWPRLEDVPDILEQLASVDMHAIQTSGNCIRNITTDPFAGVAADELTDPRPWAEILRQWSTFHPEFNYLPRKFKVAFNAATEDRVALRAYDLGFTLAKNAEGELGFTVYAGGGLGRTPLLSQKIRDFLPWQHLLTYSEAVLRVYNRYGRRDNPWKARIKILLKALGNAEFTRQVEEEWAHLQDGPQTLTAEEVARVSAHFAPPPYADLPALDLSALAGRHPDGGFPRWLQRNVRPHRQPGYAAVVLSLKRAGCAPGDATAEQMETVAQLADTYSFGELRVTHEQNLVLADVPQGDLHAVWQAARAAGLATPNVGLLTDMITCPGGDFCSLANAKSIPIAAALEARFADLDHLFDIGDLELNISGCMNSCGHHHLGAIGILGVDKHGEEWYQVTLGGAQGNAARIGEVIGRAFAAAEVPDAIERIVETYLAQRLPDESFQEAVLRLGLAPFREAAYRKLETVHA